MIFLEDMPEKGLLQFFDNDDCYGYNGPSEVRYMEKYTTDEMEQAAWVSDIIIYCLKLYA